MRHVQIQTTPVCNARCTMCPHHDSRLAKEKEAMTDEVFLKVVEGLVGIKMGKMVPYLQNEPFADPKLAERVSSLYTAFQFTHLEVSTNASIMTEARLDDLLSVVKGRRMDLLFSVPAVEPAIYAERTGLNYETAMMHIAMALRITDDMPAVHRQIQCCGIGDPHAFWDRFCREHRIKRRPYLSKFGVVSRAGNVVRDHRAPKRRAIDFSWVNCPRLHQWVHVNWKGELISCCHDYHGEAILGSLLEDSAEDILDRARDTMQKLGEQRRDFLCFRCETRG